MSHSKCECKEPTASCPRYGFMKGRKWEVCQGPPSADRDKMLDSFLKGMKRVASSIVTQAASFIANAAAHILNELKEVSDDEHKKRLAICQSCEHKDKSSWTCKLCGCDMNIKAKWATASCPIKKWDAFITIDELLNKVKGCGCS